MESTLHVRYSSKCFTFFISFNYNNGTLKLSLQKLRNLSKVIDLTSVLFVLNFTTDNTRTKIIMMFSIDKKYVCILKP